jgi:hypothetical protein
VRQFITLACLTVIVMFVARRHWLIFRRPAMCLSVVNADERMNVTMNRSGFAGSSKP